GGPGTSRTKVVPPPARVTGRPAGSGGPAAMSAFDIDDLDRHGGPGGVVGDLVADGVAHEGLAQGRGGRDDGQVVAALLDGAHQVALDLVVALVPQRHDRAAG